MTHLLYTRLGDCERKRRNIATSYNFTDFLQECTSGHSFYRRFTRVQRSLIYGALSAFSGNEHGNLQEGKKTQKPIQTSANWLSTNQGLRKGSEPQKGRTSHPEVRIYPQHPQGLLSIPRLGGPSFVIKTSRKRCDVPNVTQWLYYVQIGGKARRHYQAASVRCASFRKLKDFKVNVWLSGRCWPIGSHPKHLSHLLDEQVRYHRGVRRVASKEEKRKKTPNMSDKNWSIRLPTALRRPLRQGKRYSMI